MYYIMRARLFLRTTFPMDTILRATQLYEELSVWSSRPHSIFKGADSN